MDLDRQQQEKTGEHHPSAAAADETFGLLDTMEGLATTQEQLSDMYKMGTIEDWGSTR